MARAIGIDLGTSNSCVAVVEDGRPKVICDTHGRSTVPSIYAIDALQRPIVGYEAKEQQASNRLNTIFGVKRLIGRKFSSPEIQGAASKLPFKILPADNGDAWVEINGTPTSPEEVSSQVLRRMKEVAEEYLGERVVQAVITVPAHFNDSQRQATKDAGRLSGLDVMRIINEPTAAALAFGLDSIDEEKKRKSRTEYTNRSSVDRMIAVFDLGGGTFDISILELCDGVFEVRATNGDTFLGGEDFDMAIAMHLLDQFKQKTGMDISKDRGILQRFNQTAKDAKHSLSDIPKVEIELPFVHGMDHLKLTLDRKTVEDLVMPSLMKLQEPTLQCMEDAGLIPEDITDVILVGGMTRMPAVKKACRKIFGRDPLDSIDPDEAVALGAAVQAGLLQGLVKGVSFLDVTSLSLGMEIQGGRNHVLVHRNSPIPTSTTEIFTTSAPNQPQVSIHVLQGESDFAPDNKSLGRFELTGVRPAPRGVPEIAVTFDVDADGIINVSAKDLDTGQQQTIEIMATSGLSDYEIDRMLREKKMEDEQRDRQSQRQVGDLKMNPEDNGDDELSEVKGELKSLIFVLQARLNTEANGYKGRGRAMLDDNLAQARLLLDRAKSKDEIEKSIAALNEQNDKIEDFLETLW